MVGPRRCGLLRADRSKTGMDRHLMAGGGADADAPCLRQQD